MTPPRGAYLLMALALLASACSDDGDGAAPTPSRTATPAPTATQTGTATRTDTVTPLPSHTPVPTGTMTSTLAVSTPTGTETGTPTVGPTDVVLPTLTPTLPSGPINSDLAVSSNGGGCYPDSLHGDLIDMLNLVNPHWVPIVNGTQPDADPVLFHGVVQSIHGDTFGGDFPIDHTHSDVVADILLDENERFRAATGNPPGIIALEWDGDGYPEFAWPGDGDRIVVLGRWVWDCGHTGAETGRCSLSTATSCIRDSDCRPPTCASCAATETCTGVHFNYQSEIHPPHATAVLRTGRGGVVSSDPGAQPVPVTRTDIWISSNGGGAADRCQQTHLRNTAGRLALECYPLSQPLAHINSTDFSFDVPLPPRPAGGQPSYRVIERAAYGGVPAAIEITPLPDALQPHLAVRVKMTTPTVNGLPTGYAGTILAGWVNDTTPFTHVRLTVTGMVIRNALQPRTPASPRACVRSGRACDTSADCDAGDQCLGVGPVKTWHTQAQVNGEWQEFPGLETVNTGDVIAQQLVYEQYLPAGGTLHLIGGAVGEDCIGTMFGKSFKTNIAEQGFGSAAQCLLTLGGHDAGSIDVSYPGPDFGSGDGGAKDYEIVSSGGEGGNCSTTTGTLCVVDADCPQGERCATTGGAYALRYRIERLAE